MGQQAGKRNCYEAANEFEQLIEIVQDRSIQIKNAVVQQQVEKPRTKESTNV